MNLRVIPNYKRVLIQATIIAFALNGIAYLVRVEVPNAVATFSTNYVKEHNLVKPEVQTVTVPVVTKSDVQDLLK